MIRKQKKNCLIRSLRISPFLDKKIIKMLKEDRKKTKNGGSEFRGNLNPYVLSLIEADLKSRKFL